MGHLRILIVDDEEAMRESLAAWLVKDGHYTQTASGGEKALQQFAREDFDLVLLDIRMPGMDGHEFLREVKTGHPDVIVVMITAYGSIESAITAMKDGADDYLLKPFDPEHLMLLIEKISGRKKMMKEYAAIKGRLADLESSGFEDLIGCSPAMWQVFSMIDEISGVDAPVLITGETGTGKELVARAIHTRGSRRHGPFIALNCGALPEHLLESELFGHERGAFTDAVKTRLGRLEMADHGSLFLDEVGEMSEQMQIKFLRAIEEKRFVRLGGSTEIESDFRLICATHRDMKRMMDSGRVRSDFYYRINVITIRVPPLRDRIEDISLLAGHFMDRFSKEMNKSMEAISPQAFRVLETYPWPGNVRELRNAIERAVVVNRDGVISAEDLGFLHPATGTVSTGASLEEVELRHIRNTLEDCDWNISKAADILQINRSTLTRKVNKYRLARPHR